MNARIVACTSPAELHRHYPNERYAQPCFVELDLQSGTLLADTDPDVSGGVPEAVRRGMERRYRIPALTADAANELLAELLPLAGRILADWREEWDGHRHIAVLGDDARRAEQEIRDRIGDPEDWERSELVSDWDVDVAITGSEAEEYGITADTTDARLDEIAEEITAGLAETDPSGVVVIKGLETYLRELRDGLAAEEEPMSDAEFRILRDGLGLTGEQMAVYLGVAPRTVRNWEQGRYEVPSGVARALRGLEQETADLVEETVADLTAACAADAVPNLTVYRTDEDYLASNPQPARTASWHRAFVGRVARQVAVTLTYAS